MYIFKKLIPYLLIFAILGIIFGCTDSLDKSTSYDDAVRIEYSDCLGLGCLECVERFSCSENAIKTDDRTGINYIDADLCVQCMECVNIFQCPEDAFRTQPDLIPPAPVTNLTGVSPQVGVLYIDFIATGDDSTDTEEARAYEYLFKLTNENGENIPFNFNLPVPFKIGVHEWWNPIDSLPPGENVTIHITAVDEAGNASTEASAQVQIMDYPDETAPAAVNDLSMNNVSTDEFTLNWTAVGDDGMEGVAESYIIKIATEYITAGNWDDILEYGNDLIPANPGEPEVFIISGLDENTTYFAAIKTIDDNDNISLLSNVPTATTEITPDIIPPSAINDLQIDTNSISMDAFTLNWTAVGDDGMEGVAESYIIKISTESITASNWDDIPEFQNDLVPLSPGEQEQFTITGLESETSYHVAVKAVDDTENVSAISNVVNAFTLPIFDVVPPAAIDDLQIDSNSISMDTFTLNWTAVGDDEMQGTADSYIVKIHTEMIDENNWDSITEYSQNLIPLVSGSTETLSITGLDPLTEYFTAVKAVDDCQNIAEISNIASAVTTDIPDNTPPAAITDLEADPTETTIELAWTSPGDDGNTGVAAYYEIRYSETEIDDSNWDSALILSNPPVPLVAGSSQSYSATVLDLNITYYFAIKTNDESDNTSDLSNVPSATIYFDLIPPATITDLNAEGTEFEIELSWTSPGDDGNEGTADHYEIRIHDVEITEANWDETEILPGPPWPLTAGSPQNYTVDGLEHNQIYYFGIKAIDDNENISEASNSPFSMLINDITPPADITNLSVYAGYATNLTTIKIQWTAPGDNGDEGICDHYEVRYSTQPIDEDNWANASLFNDPPDPLIAGANQFCNVTGLNSATIYYFAVKAFDEIGNVNNVSNSPAGKLVYQINTAACHNCANCINDCDQNAIHQGAGYKYINPDQCTACGDCSCPWNLIYRAVVAY